MLLTNETDLRAVMQLPNRPYSEPLLYDGSPYYDFTRRELNSVISVSGTVSNSAHIFVANTDFTVHDGVIDWSSGAVKPDFGTVFTPNYYYSRLAAPAVSTSLFFAEQIVTTELGPNFPYGTIGSGTVDKGFDYNKLAKMMQIFVAAREACFTLASADLDTSDKYRRGSVQVDDTKKGTDWKKVASDWDAKYMKYLNLVRPTGQIHHFSLTSRSALQMVFADWGALQSANAALRELAVDAYATGDFL